MNAKLKITDSEWHKSAGRALQQGQQTSCKALRHILEVIHLVWFEHYERGDAQLAVAEKYDITKETVMDSFSARRGGASQEYLDRLLLEPDLDELEKNFYRRFKTDPETNNIIKGFFATIRRCERSKSFSIDVREILPLSDENERIEFWKKSKKVDVK